MLGLGTAVVPLDSALNIAFPPITAHFGLPLAEIQWMVISYVLTYGSLMLGIGRLGDIFGHARVFRAGLAWSVVTFLLCAAAPSYGWLLAGRVLQGIGAALIISCGPALATALFPESYRPRALALYTLLFSLGSVLGPSLGGVLLAQWGWPATFWFRAPIALTALLLLRGLPAPPTTAGREAFDLPGAVLLALTTGSLLLTINQARHGMAALPWAVLFLLALVGFLWRSGRAPRPIIALRIFRLPGFALLNLSNALLNLAAFSVLLFVPYYLVRIAGLSLGLGGVVLACSALGAMLAAAPAGWLLARLPARRLAASGIALTGCGLGLMALWGTATPLPLIIAALLLHGAGMGLLQVSYTEIVTATLPRADRGVAGSLAMMTRTLGVVSAASLLTLLFASLEAPALAAGATPAGAFLAGFTPTFAGAALLCALVAAGLLRRKTH